MGQGISPNTVLPNLLHLAIFAEEHSKYSVAEINDGCILLFLNATSKSRTSMVKLIAELPTPGPRPELRAHVTILRATQELGLY